MMGKKYTKENFLLNNKITLDSVDLWFIGFSCLKIYDSLKKVNTSNLLCKLRLIYDRIYQNLDELINFISFKK